MIYYKVPTNLDGKQVTTKAGYFSFVGGELLTAAQLKKYGFNPSYFEAVNASQKKIYFFFGARFAL